MYQPEPSFTVETRVNAYPEQIWEAWTDADRISQWFADKASGWPAVGSQLALTWDGFGFTAQYQIAESKPLEKLVLKARMTGGLQTLTIGIRREGQQTVLSLSEIAPQFQKTDPESQADTASGWKMALSICKLYVEKYFGQPRSSFFCLGAAEFSYPEIMGAYGTSEGLAQWLATEVVEWGQERYQLKLEDDLTMTGRVIAITTHEICLEWEEIHGFLELKAFTTVPPRRALCLRGSGWNLAPDKAKHIQELLDRALGRLLAALRKESPTS